MPIDGQIIACWLTMGIPVGLLCLAAYGWAGLMAIASAWRTADRDGVVLGAVALGAVVVQMPLATISSGELAVLFWMFAAIAGARREQRASTSVQAWFAARA